VRIQHVAECPEVDPVLCATETIPAHLHDQHIDWLRVDPGLSVGLGRGWQVGVNLPADLRVARVDYTTLDGDPYDPPYADIHHRDETLAGLVDGALGVRRYATTGHGVYGAALGVTLPFGRTEEDPFALTEQGLEHQHQQLGTGTFVPTAGADAIYSAGRWGGLAWGAGRVPLYENRKGYRPPLTATLGGGPTLRIVPTLQGLASAELLVEGPERWAGEPHGGRVAVLAGVGALWSVSDRVVLQASARATAWQGSAEAESDEGALVQPLIVGVGLSWTRPSGAATEE